jgi:hypothetical protein
VVEGGGGEARAHVEVKVRGPESCSQRGAGGDLFKGGRCGENRGGSGRSMLHGGRKGGRGLYDARRMRRGGGCLVLTVTATQSRRARATLLRWWATYRGGGSGGGHCHVGRSGKWGLAAGSKESNLIFLAISNKFKIIQTWFIPKLTFLNSKILK